MRPALTRSSIVGAARDHLVAEGLDAVSLRRIASHLGVTAPALYAYVTDKLDLLRAIARLEVEKLLTTMDAMSWENPVDRLRGLSEAYLAFAQDNKELFRAIFLTKPELTSEPIEGEPALASMIFERVRAAMLEAVKRDDVTADDAALSALAFWSAIHGAVVLLVAGPRLHPDDERTLLAATTATVLNGLGAGQSLAGQRR